MKTLASYGLLLGIAYILSSLTFLVENVVRKDLSIPQLLPAEGGMVFYFLTVGSLYGYAYLRYREEVFKATLLVASIMSIGLMIVQVISSIPIFISILTSNTRIETAYSTVRIEVVLGLLSIPLLLKVRKNVYE